MTKVWYTADTHFGHARIIELCGRPFASVEEMDQTIIDNFNAVIADDDILWILGDVALGRLDDSLARVAQLKGRKRLVPGNHDRVFEGYHSKGVKERDVERYEAAGLSIYSHSVVNRFGWTLCHFPDQGDSGDEERFAKYRPQPYPWRLLVHGHVHEKWKTRGHRVNVGVDVWDFKPVAEEHLQRYEEALILAGAVRPVAS